MATNLKAIRKAAGLTQDELGKKVGFSGSHISGLETGEKNLYFDDALKFADILNCSLVDLVEGEKKPRTYKVPDSVIPTAIDRDLMLLAGQVVNSLIDEGIADVDKAEFWDLVTELYEIAVDIKINTGNVTTAGLMARWVKQSGQA